MFRLGVRKYVVIDRVSDCVRVCLHECECVCYICMCVFVKTVSIAIGVPVLSGKQ